MTGPSDRGPLDEDAWVARAIQRVQGGGPLVLGPGHDCAVVAVGAEVVVVTTDVLVDGVHFELAVCGAAAAAGKALLVNLSDLAAAGATPIACEVGVVLPRGAPPALLEALADGFGAVARAHGCPVAGGDTNVADGPLVLAVTALGRPGPGGVISRAGARVGDVLSVTGPLGGSLSGRHLAFAPRLAEGALLARLGVAHAMMDLSDGLSRDLPRLCRASGVGARIEASRVPVHTDVTRADDERSPLEHALDDGEDFELLVAHAPLSPATARELAAAGVTLTRVGTVVTATEGVRIVLGGTVRALVAKGWDHFLSRPRLAEQVWEVRTATEADTRRLGRALGLVARAIAPAGLVVALEGDLGSGKTVLVQGLAEGLGVPPAAEVVSPTFQVARSYDALGVPPFRLHHVDAYRLRGTDDLEAAGWEDLGGKHSLTCVEWGSRVEDALPHDRLEVSIRAEDPSAPPGPGTVPVAPRAVRVRARGARARTALLAWRAAWEACS